MIKEKNKFNKDAQADPELFDPHMHLGDLIHMLPTVFTRATTFVASLFLLMKTDLL